MVSEKTVSGNQQGKVLKLFKQSSKVIPFLKKNDINQIKIRFCCILLKYMSDKCLFIRIV